MCADAFRQWVLSSLLGLFLGLPVAALGQLHLDLEAGMSHNLQPLSVRTSTSASQLTDELNPALPMYVRIRLGASFGNKLGLHKRHTLLATWAPTHQNAEGVPTEVFEIAGRSFDDVQEVTAHIRQRTYRLTYRYDVFWYQDLQFAIGVSVQAVQSRLSLINGTERYEPTVWWPAGLVHSRLRWEWVPYWALYAELDAGLGESVAMFDGIAGVQYYLQDELLLGLHYRLLYVNRTAQDLSYRLREYGPAIKLTVQF